MNQINHFSYERSRFDSDIPSSIISIKARTSIELNQIEPVLDNNTFVKLHSAIKLPLTVLRYEITKPEFRNTNPNQPFLSVRLASCKMNADPNQYFQAISGLTVPKKNCVNFKM